MIAPPECCWTAARDFGQIAVTSDAAQCGNGEVCYDLAPYFGELGQISSIVVGDRIFSVGQPRGGTPTNTATRMHATTPTPTPEHCVQAVQPSSVRVSPLGETGCFTVVADPACCWSAHVSTGFDRVLSVTSGDNGCGPGDVCFNASFNESTSARSMEIHVDGQVFQVMQDRYPTPQSRADLVLASTYISLPGFEGGCRSPTSTTLRLFVCTQNRGATLAGPFDVLVNGQLFDRVDMLSPGITVCSQGAYTYPADTTVVLDPKNEVAESNESNNESTQFVPIPTLPPTCTPDSSGATATPTPATATPTIPVTEPAGTVMATVTVPAIVTPTPGANQFVVALAVEPAQPWTLYAATSDAGVFKTIDGGTTWRAAGLRDEFITALSLDSTMPLTLYGGSLYEGVFKSTDGGTTWSGAGLRDSDVNTLAVDPNRSGIVYAGTSGGLYKSTDGGATWGAIDETASFYFVSTLATQRGTPDTIYVGTGGTLCGVHPGRCAGVFKTTDAGSAWHAVNTGLPYYSFVGDLPYTDVYALVIDATPDTLYAGTSAGVFKSTDAGGLWTAVSSGLPSADVYALVVDPTMSDTVYAGTSAGMFKSVSGGDEWIAASTGLPVDTVVFALVVQSSFPGALYAGTNHGVFKSENSASTWVDVSAGLTPPCVGDCTGTGTVHISDLMLGVNIVLGAQPVSACPAFASGLGWVDVVQLVQAVNNALHGCRE